MPADLSTYDSALKEYYVNVMVSILNKKVKLLDLFTKNIDAPRDAGGRRVVYSLHRNRNVGVGAVSEGNTLPTAGNQGFSEVRIPFFYNYARVQLTEQAIKASMTSKGAFKQATKAEMEGAVNDLARERNRQLWGFGVGILGRVNGEQPDNTVINVDSPHGVTGSAGGAKLMVDGQAIAFVRNATPTSATDSDIVATASVKAIDSIAADQTSITLTATTGATLNDNDMIVNAPAGTGVTTQSSVNKEPMGLLGIVDDTTYLTTLHNISRSSFPNYRAAVINQNGTLTLDALQRAWDLADERGGAAKKLLSHHSVRREYQKLLTPLKRYVGKGLVEADGGFDGGSTETNIEWNGIPWVVERMCPFGMIFGIDPENMVRYVESEGEWADRDGKILNRVLNVDAYEGRFRVFDNFHCERPNTNFRIDNVTATIDAQSATE